MLLTLFFVFSTIAAGSRW